MVGRHLGKLRPHLGSAAMAASVDPAVDLSPVVSHPKPARRSSWEQFSDILQTHSFILFTLLFLLIAAAGIDLGGRYYAAHKIVAKVVPAPAKHSITGLNLSVPASELPSKITTITSQPATLTVGTQTVNIPAATIKSWLNVTANSSKTQDAVYVSSDSMVKSLTALANSLVKAPVNAVTVTHNGISQVIVGGRNGTRLTDPTTLATQAHQFAKNVMGGKGLNFTTPLETQPFQAVTPADFPKLIEADITNKVTYFYQGGQLINTFLSSDGAPDTPTPIGEYQIYAKYAVQTMSGNYPTKYVQPNVPWVNYFTAGNAVHGVYWHPLSWFGVNNSSHGCVGLPVDEAHWVYDWAPIGTTVITHL